MATVHRITAMLAGLVGLLGSAGVAYGAWFWLPYHLQGGRFPGTGIVLIVAFLGLLLLSWAPLAVRRLKPGARPARLLAYDLAWAAGTAVLAVPFLLAPLRLVFLLALTAHLVLLCGDLAGCLRGREAY